MREAKSQPPKPSIQTFPRATGGGAGPADTDLGLWGAARAARRLLACGTMPRGRPKGSKDLKLRKRRGANKKPAAAASAGVTEEEEEETQEVHTTQAGIDAMFGQVRIVHGAAAAAAAEEDGQHQAERGGRGNRGHGESKGA